MKTALQELIERLEQNRNASLLDKPYAEGLEEAISLATELIEKEREQIENAWLNGVSAWDSEMEAEQYYNEIFNQKQIR